MLNLFLIPRVDYLLSDNENYFTIEESRFILSDTQKERLLQTIERIGTKIISTDIKIIDPKFSRYVLNIGIIAFDDIPTDLIKNDIIEAVSNYFLNINRLDRIPKSDIIKIIEEINGVDSVSIKIISENNEKNKMLYRNANDISIDNFNDIIIAKNELPIIRGGWSDRYGNSYENTIDTKNLGSLNILIKDITKRSES